MTDDTPELPRWERFKRVWWIAELHDLLYGWFPWARYWTELDD